MSRLPRGKVSSTSRLKAPAPSDSRSQSRITRTTITRTSTAPATQQTRRTAPPARPVSMGATSRTSQKPPPCAARTLTVKPAPEAAPKKPKRGEFDLPPLSTLHKGKPKAETLIEKLKKKTIRRNKPEGEDPKKIREIIRDVKKQDITVHEFVGMVSPYTGDNGAVLRQILADDLAYFRNMVRKVYETMTQDVSDVLANEQLQLMDYYKEKHEQLTNKMRASVNEIFMLAPDFDFEKYHYNTAEYLQDLFPLPEDTQAQMDPERYELQKREEAFHRLQWLRTEGERLSDENARLQARLKELKKQQREELQVAARREQEVEMKKVELEAAQAEAQNKLEVLNESLEKSIVELEVAENQKEKQMMKAAVRSRSSAAGVKKSTSRISVKGKGKWNVTAAADIDEAAAVAPAQAATSRGSVGMSSRSSIAAGKKVKTASRKDFHFSPIKTPPKKPAEPKPLSPFHFSPPKTPPEIRMQAQAQARQQSPYHSPSRGGGQQQPEQPSRRTIVETTTTVTKPIPPRMGRSQAPRDTWGGF